MASVSAAETRRRQAVTRAAELFDRDGYHAINVEQLARAIGLSKAALYHYFSSKEEILFWIHEEFIDLLLQKAELAPADLSPAERLERVMGDILDLMRTHRGHVRVFFEHYRELSRENQDVIRTKRDRYREIVEGLVQEGIDAGDFRPVDPRLVTLAIFGMCNWAYQWYRIDGLLAPREIGAFFAGLLFDGFRQHGVPSDVPDVFATAEFGRESEPES